MTSETKQPTWKRVKNTLAVLLLGFFVYKGTSCATNHTRYKRESTLGEKSLVCEITEGNISVKVSLWRLKVNLGELPLVGTESWDTGTVIEVFENQLTHLHMLEFRNKGTTFKYINFNLARTFDWRTVSDLPADWKLHPDKMPSSVACQKIQVAGDTILVPQLGYKDGLGVSRDKGKTFQNISDGAFFPYVSFGVIDDVPRFLARDAFDIEKIGKFRPLPVKGFNGVIPAHSVELTKDGTVRATHKLILPTRYAAVRNPNSGITEDEIEWRNEPSIAATYEQSKESVDWRLVSLQQIGSLDMPPDVELILPTRIPIKMQK